MENFTSVISEYIKADKYRQFQSKRTHKIVKSRRKIAKNCRKNVLKMKIEKLLYLISAMACSDTSSSGVKYVRLRDVPVKHCILKNCQFCAYSFELDATRFLPQKWSHVGRVVCAKMLLQRDCCDEYLRMNRWMMF